MKQIAIVLLFLVLVSSQEIFNVVPSSFSITAYTGGLNPSSKTVTMTVGNPSGFLSWSASNYASWLSINPSSGSIYVSSFFTISFDISSLKAGTQSTIITVTLEGKTTPSRISVVLSVLNSNCDERQTCDTCITYTQECGWCANSDNVTLGTCIGSTDSSQCNSTDWFNAYCPKSCSVPCVHGYCELSSGVCSCDFNYYGDECNIYCNPAKNCSSEGSCANDGTCYCNNGYYGESCQYKYCPGSTGDGCSGHGICNNVTGTCTCDSDYYGNDCSAYCNATQCGHGSCSTTGHCTCDTDYYGQYCNFYCDPAKNCTNHGVCSIYGCQCYAGYYQKKCNVYCEKDKTCSNNGDCSWNGTCICHNPYFSTNCELKHCPGYNASSDVECFGNGHCNDTEGICSCDANWYMQDCSVYCDEKVTCSGHGTCSDSGTCLCSDGYDGDACGHEKVKEKSGHRDLIIAIGVGAALIVVVVGAVIIVRRRRTKSGYAIIQ